MIARLVIYMLLIAAGYAFLGVPVLNSVHQIVGAMGRTVGF